MRNEKLKLTALLVALVLANAIEVRWDGTIEALIWQHLSGVTGASYGQLADARQVIAGGVQLFEGGYEFDNRVSERSLIVYGYGVVYVFVWLGSSLLVILYLAIRPEIKYYRIFCRAILIDYALSLPFFLLFPLPERWSYANSSAIPLLDTWSSSIVSTMRVVSGLDNSLPSFHVSSTTLIVFFLIRFKMPYRFASIPIGLTVVASTLVLGIHWVPDMICGVLAGYISLAAATLWERKHSKNIYGSKFEAFV